AGASAVILIVLAYNVRQVFWKVAAQAGPDAWRTYLLQLPLGVPEGSVRALVSLFVIVFGLFVLVLQKQLALNNVEAVSGFICIVITFYLTSRGGDQAQKAVDAAREAAANAQTAVSNAVQESRTQLQNAASGLTGATQRIVATPPPAAQPAADQPVAGQS